MIAVRMPASSTTSSTSVTSVAGLPCECAARLDDNLQTGIFIMESFDKACQVSGVVILTCDQMSASHVEPFKSRNQMSVTLFKRVQHLLEVMAVRFAEGVKMKALYSFRKSVAEVFGFSPKRDPGTHGL